MTRLPDLTDLEVACKESDLAVLRAIADSGVKYNLPPRRWAELMTICAQSAKAKGGEAATQLPDALDTIIHISGKEKRFAQTTEITHYPPLGDAIALSGIVEWMAWGQRRRLALDNEQTTGLIDFMRANMESLDVFGQAGWRKAGPLTGIGSRIDQCALALSLFRGDDAHTLQALIRHLKIPAYEIVLGVIGHVAQRANDPDATPLIHAPDPESLALIAPFFTPELTQKIKQNHWPSGHADDPVDDLMREIDQAKAEVAARALRQNTSPTSNYSRPSVGRL